MAGSRIGGVIAAAVTPVTAGYGIDSARLQAHVARLLDQGCSHVATFGTTGEGASFSTRDKLDALAALRAGGADMSRQIPAAMTPVLSEAVDMVRGAADLGCRAVLVLPPFYYATSEAGIADWYGALIDRTGGADGIDLLLYNIPQLSGRTFTPDLIRAILDRARGRVVGIKDSTGSLESGLALVKAFPELAVLTGDDRVLPHLVRAGGAGMIGGMPNLFARDLAALCADPARDDLLAAQTQRIVAVDQGGSLVALKAGLAHYLGDEELARPMPPLRPMEASQRHRLIAAFDESGFRP